MNPWQIQIGKCRFGGQGLLAEAGTAAWHTAWQLCCSFSGDGHKLVKKSIGAPRNHIHCAWFYFYLLAKEVPRQIRQCNQDEGQDYKLAAKSDPCSSERTEAFLTGQKYRLEVGLLSGSWEKKQITAKQALSTGKT